MEYYFDILEIICRLASYSVGLRSRSGSTMGNLKHNSYNDGA